MQWAAINSPSGPIVEVWGPRQPRPKLIPRQFLHGFGCWARAHLMLAAQKRPKPFMVYNLANRDEILAVDMDHDHDGPSERVAFCRTNPVTCTSIRIMANNRACFAWVTNARHTP